MNPFGEWGSSHSTWPVTLCMFNLPSSLCMKRKYMMMTVLIQGQKQLANNIDVYLRLLVDELLLLWKKEGVCVWDEYKQETFDLPALLFITINDCLALSNLSRQSNKVYQDYTHCLDETISFYLKIFRRSCIWAITDFSTLEPLGKERKTFQRGTGNAC